jgi:hypothetical protein
MGFADNLLQQTEFLKSEGFPPLRAGQILGEKRTPFDRRGDLCRDGQRSAYAKAIHQMFAELGRQFRA